MNYRLCVIGSSFVFIFHEFFVSDAYAYLDPGSGSIVIQALIGALVGAGIALKVYWEKIKWKLSSKLSKSKDDE
jgi:hypothetical protein